MEQARGSSVIAGDRVAAGAYTMILRYRLSTALPIPLAVAAPAGIRLVTWAFAGLAAGDPLGPRGLLVLARDEATDPLGGVRLATHFREIDIAIGEAAQDLRPAERALAARAMLVAASPDETAALADLIGRFAEDIAALVPEAAAPTLAVENERWLLSGLDVPGHLLLREGAGWSCHRVARASLHLGLFAGQATATSHSRPHPKVPRSGLERGFPNSPGLREGSFEAQLRLAPRIKFGASSQDEGGGWRSEVFDGPHARLSLERVWGVAPAGRPDVAIGLTRDGFAPYRIAR